MELLFPATAFVLGAIVGSFLNVVIHRYPREESIVFPASHCGSCGVAIRPYDNVPILSYLWLRGRCRSCHAPFSIRYPLVELANALFYLAIFQRTGLSLLFVPVAAFVSMTIVLIYIDAEIQMLPDVITLPGVALGVAMSLIAYLAPDLMLSASWIDSLAGAAIGAGIVTAIILTYWLVRRVEGMGWGDVKMMAMLGAAFGWEPMFPLLVLASVAGGVVGGIVALRSAQGMQAAIPFGIFLGLAALVMLFFGPTLWSWYLALVLR